MRLFFLSTSLTGIDLLQVHTGWVLNKKKGYFGCLLLLETLIVAISVPICIAHDYRYFTFHTILFPSNYVRRFMTLINYRIVAGLYRRQGEVCPLHPPLRWQVSVTTSKYIIKKG
jgi:hypothetical protein